MAKSSFKNWLSQRFDFRDRAARDFWAGTSGAKARIIRCFNAALKRRSSTERQLPSEAQLSTDTPLSTEGQLSRSYCFPLKYRSPDRSST
jgi:hypothetical protein